MLFDNPIILDIYIRASNRNEKDWSLAELQLTPQEYNVCCEYANSITKSELAEYFNNSLFKKKITALSKGVSEVALIGFFLLLISAEIIRREGSGKRLWSVVYQKLSRDAQDTLFSNNIQPNQKMKEAIEKAAKEFQLRNVFGVDGLKEWFDTVYLQIGFTHDGLINHLPEWLCRIEPVAIQYLLGKQGNVASESLKKTWILLKNFRNYNVTEQYVRNHLSHNPWILPEWIDELMDSARKAIPISEYMYHLSQSEVARADSPPFLSHPLLRWKPSQRPEFFCEIQNLANLYLNQPDYDIKINNKPIKRLYRQDDGTYSCEEMELVLPKPTATIYVSMVDNVHNIVQEFSSLLWDSNEDLTIFDLKTGEMLQPIESQMFLDRDYALLLAEDLVIRPTVEKYYKIRDRKLYYLQKNWAATLEIPKLFWKPCLGMSKLKQDDSNEIMIFCQPSEVKLGQCITLQVKSAEGIEILSIRVAAHPFDLSQNRLRITITPNLIHSVDPITQTTKLKFKFGLRKGNDNYIINKMLTIKIVGVAYHNDNEGQWEILNPHKQFTVEQAKFGRFRIFGVRGYLFEGQSSIRQVQPQKSESIGMLAGLGDRLTVRQNNDSTSEELIILAEAVVDIGILQSVKIDGNLLSLYLPYVLKPSVQHHILWIGSTGEIVWLTVNENKNKHDDENNHYLWQSEISQLGLTRPLLIGISYNGECLGSWWESGWLHLLENPQEPEKIAYLIRWLKLPVLSSKYLQAVQKFALEYADEILDQWFSSKECTMAGFNLSIKNSESWIAVISEIFPNYPFTPVQQKLLLPKWLRLGTLVEHKKYGVGRFDDVDGELLRIQYADAVLSFPINSWKDFRVVDTNHALDSQSSKRKKLLR